MKTDIAIGVISLAPLAFLLWKVAQDERITMSTFGPLALLYCWTMGACFILLIRKISDRGLRKSAWLFSSGSFASCFVLSFSALPPMWAVGVVPVCTYLMTKMRAQHYFQLDLRKKMAERHTGQGQLEV